ncbi:MAG: hypothetical protein R3C03_08485 [Pirellulaceae bacterium]
MAKFYVTNNISRLVVQAEDAEGAALWALHQAMEANSSESGNSLIDSERAFQDWDSLTLVSEQGFDRDDAGCFDTDKLVQVYSQLMIALERISNGHCEL